MSELNSQNTSIYLEQKARSLIGKSFKEIELESNFNDEAFELKEPVPKYLSNNNQYDELYNIIDNFFEKDNSKDTNIFVIKILPYKKFENQYYVMENLFLSQIHQNNNLVSDFYSSDICKNNKFFLIFYNQDESIKNPIDYKIDFINFFVPSHIDQIIIQQDYDYIINYIKSGKKKELSESETMYLSACIKERCFCYKKSYLSFIINNNIKSNQDTESIIEDEKKFLKSINFEDYINSLINLHVGKTDKTLCKEFNLRYNNGKAQWINIVYEILGMKSGVVAEFLKSNIIIKAIRIEENGNIIQSSSLPPVKFMELSRESWEESIIFKYFDQTKFLFVVFKKEKNCYILKGCQLWNMSYDDLNTEVYDGWYKIKKIIQSGVKFKIQTNKKGETIVKNNLPSKAENRIIHMRPHASHAFYKLKDGFTEGKVADGDLLPDGQYMTKQSFWINNSYILSILKDELKN